MPTQLKAGNSTANLQFTGAADGLLNIVVGPEATLVTALSFAADGTPVLAKPLPVASGGTNAITAAAARTSLGLDYPAFGRVVRTAGNITTTSTTLVDVTGATVTLTTGAFPVAYGVAHILSNVTAGVVVITNIAIDGVLQHGTSGLILRENVVDSEFNGSFSAQSAALSAGSHTIKEQWRVGSSTGTLYADANYAFHFYAQEIR